MTWYGWAIIGGVLLVIFVRWNYVIQEKNAEADRMISRHFEDQRRKKSHATRFKSRFPKVTQHSKLCKNCGGIYSSGADCPMCEQLNGR